jgi:hypothetical protein
MKVSTLICVFTCTTQLLAVELRDVIDNPSKYSGQHVEVTGIAQVAGWFYLFPDEASADKLDMTHGLLVRYGLSRRISYKDFDREWVRISGVMSSEPRSGWYPGTGVLLERIEIVRDRPRPHLKADWVRAVFNNTSNQLLEIQLRRRSKAEGGFMIKAHDVREELIDPDENEVVVLQATGSTVSEKGNVLARAKIDFSKLPGNYQYLPESSFERRLYFRLGSARVEQVPASEGRHWKIALPIY